MTPEENKRQNTTMWLISVAVAVLCCAGLFVVFASFMADLKTNLADNSARIAIIEKRQDRIAVEFDLLRQHGMIQSGTPDQTGSGISVSGQPSPTVSAPVDGAVDDMPQTPASPSSAASVETPSTTPSQTAPASVAPSPSTTAPSVTVPVTPATPDKK